ncbi:MAG: UDP-N-acetylmuramoyl-L-alanine--D-glutamate ligase [Alphaproteobacteria bacterium]|nr:UDP-N-acetylmuramoyl-L-alanine--D-glutamate ligase [Alphaproteobacteria bacterium]MDA8003908.1 UDP-N-acetylmuramoyl-L-alanine--D-glutamate ligase [Alphaproteobacteria bacterium]MDA8004959.1 UDP-N-acetylmuramoyl-L-alanine--D-glutamate ligase [Alphaproteobacteria bacterium]MDA8012320.1 UDP-N-acetylmuramoyl-L-alanine--D-glutamate ligase [Alphaproteobacteria bacterium]
MHFSAADKIFVLGLGATGGSVVAAALADNASVCAWDDNPEQRRLDPAPGLSLPRNENDARRELQDATLLVWSPGIPHSGENAHPIAREAKKCGLKPVSDVEVFLRGLRAEKNSARVAAVTGTDGKSTTATLIAEFLSADGKHAVPCGNLGPPVLNVARERGTQGQPVYVLELSSFQLTITPSLAAEVAVLVSLAPDHIDWHGSLEKYISAKRAVFHNAASAVIGTDDELSAREAERIQSESGHRSPPCVRVSGRAMPDGGVGVQSDALRDRHGTVADFPDDSPFAARHNRLNAAAAFAAASLLGASRRNAESVLKNFRGLPHRYEIVGERDGVSFVNDSKATTVHAARAALAAEQNIFWIAGGNAKGQNLAPLFSDDNHARHLYAIGNAADELLRHAAAAGISATKHDSLADAFNVAASAAAEFVTKSGEGAVVLLSPACASTDDFRNFADRGNQFRKLAEHRRGVKN